MPLAQVVDLVRQTLETAILLSAPLLISAMVISVLISLAQVVTSMQEATVSTVPRLAAVAAIAVWLTPWMMRQMVRFTSQLFSDFHLYVR